MQLQVCKDAELTEGETKDMLFHLSKASDIRNTLYNKLRTILETEEFVFIDTYTKEPIIYKDGTEEDKELVWLYLGGAWYYESCTRDSAHSIVVTVFLCL